MVLDLKLTLLLGATLKKCVLFLVQLPPPVHGASMMNLYVKNSNQINDAFDAKFVDISPEKNIDGLGRFSPAKVVRTLMILYFAVLKYLKFKPELVYMTLSPHGFAFYKDALIIGLLKLCGAKFVFHLHGKGIASEVSSGFKEKLYRHVFKNVDVIHLADILCHDISSVRDLSKTIYVVENGVPDSCSPESQVEKIPTFLYLSNLIPSKGAHVLLEAINGLDESYRNKFKVYVAGGIRDSGYKKLLDDESKRKFPESIEFVGPVYGEDKKNLLARADVFVLPTSYKNECFPISLLEAMCCSLACVSTFEGAIPNIIDDGVNGRLFSVTNRDSLTKLIAQYIDKPELLLRHKAAARAKYESHYNLDVFERKLCQTLKNIVSEK